MPLSPAGIVSTLERTELSLRQLENHYFSIHGRSLLCLVSWSAPECTEQLGHKAGETGAPGRTVGQPAGRGAAGGPAGGLEAYSHSMHLCWQEGIRCAKTVLTFTAVGDSTQRGCLSSWVECSTSLFQVQLALKPIVSANQQPHKHMRQ